MISIHELPADDGYLPAGKWMVALRDNLNDSLAGTSFRAGLTVAPVDGRLLKRLVTFMPVVGALRVEGSPCRLGDVSRLTGEAPAPVVVAPVAAPAVEPAKAGPAPTNAAELARLDEPALRALCAEMGIEVDGRWGIGRVRREVARELDIEGVS